MRRIAVLIVLVLAGALTLAVVTPARGSTAAQPAPGPAVRADFNGDDIADLAIGAPGESVGAVLGAGVVNVLYGSAGGLTAAGSELFTQADGGGSIEANDSFGAALASGDFNDDGFTDLAVGAPFERVGTIVDAGAVSILFGTDDGLTGGGSLFTQAPSAPEAGDEFGAALAAGDFNSDTADDLAIGAPFENIGAVADAGLVHLAYGPALGPIAQQFAQPVSATETDDTFGFSLAAGDVNDDGISDVVAGAPFEDVGRTLDAGAVSVLDGSPTGVVAAGAQTLTQPVSAVEFGDAFGFSVAAGDFDDGGVDDAAAGAAFESVGGTLDAGAVSVLDGSPTGLTTAGAQTFVQPISAVETGDSFGFSLASGDFDDDGIADLAVGAPFESVGATVDAGAVSALYGSGGGFSAANAQTFTQVGSSVEPDDTFGWSLAAGDFDGAGVTDLAVGAPFEDVGATLDAGVVSTVPGSTGNLQVAAGRAFTQNTPSVPSVAEIGDAFGGALAAGLPVPAPAAPATGPAGSVSRARRAAGR